MQPVSIAQTAKSPDLTAILQQGGVAVAVILALTIFMGIGLEKLVKLIKALRSN
jgi:hypothetical protein